MSGKGIIILLIGVVTTAFVTFSSIFNTSSWATSNAGRFFYSGITHNLSQTGLDLALNELRGIMDFGEVNGGHESNKIATDEGSIRYKFNGATLLDSAGKVVNCTRVTSFGMTNYDTIVTILYVRQPEPDGDIVARIKAAMGAATNLRFPGQASIDGRNHDLLGNPISNCGTFAIWSKGGLGSQGQPEVGGTYYPTNPAGFYTPEKKNGTDYDVKSKWSEDVLLKILSLNHAGEPFPDNPDSVVGTRPGTPQSLMERAKVKGTYYTSGTDAGLNSSGKHKGIIYVDAASFTPSGFIGEGILVVHNSNNNAILKYTGNNDGFQFTGLVIADKLDNFHGKVIGGVVELYGDVNNNGSGKSKILYSRQALNQSESYLKSDGKKIKENVLTTWQGTMTMYKKLNQ